MLRLNLIVHNPTADAAITWLGIGVLVLSAALMLVGLWMVLARGREVDESTIDSEIEAMRHWRLVVRRPRKSAGPGTALVAELQHTDDPEPSRH